jgi:hypothetical protein
VTWGIVVYPAWDRWPEPSSDIRAAVENWLHSWLTEGPPSEGELVERHIETIGRTIRYFRATHDPTGVIVTFLVGRTNDHDYVALLDLRSPPPSRSPPT